MDVHETDVQSDRIFTVPNILSFLRLLGVPLFLWLILVPQADWWALAVLAFAGVSDYLDGYLARRWHQITRIGQLLDPLADRFYILATLIGLLLRDIIPLWLVVVLISRDVVMACFLLLLKRLGITGLPVHFIGKAATAALLYAFPLLLLGAQPGTLGLVARIIGWACALWGAGLYWWAGILYMEQAMRILRRRPAST